MRYVITFERYDGECESYTVSSSCIELAIMDAKEKAKEKHNDFDYCDSDILSIIRI